MIHGVGCRRAPPNIAFAQSPPGIGRKRPSLPGQPLGDPASGVPFGCRKCVPFARALTTAPVQALNHPHFSRSRTSDGVIRPSVQSNLVRAWRAGAETQSERKSRHNRPQWTKHHKYRTTLNYMRPETADLGSGPQQNVSARPRRTSHLRKARPGIGRKRPSLPGTLRCHIRFADNGVLGSQMHPVG